MDGQHEGFEVVITQTGLLPGVMSRHLPSAVWTDLQYPGTNTVRGSIIKSPEQIKD